jgi:hypothetical protein
MEGKTITLLVPETAEERQLLGTVYMDYARQLLGPAVELRQSEAAAAETSYLGEGGQPNLRRFVAEVHAPNARRALRAIADETIEAGSPPDSDRLRERLNLDTGGPNRLGGMLTSVGFAMKRTGLPRPYADRWGGDRQTYVMDREVAENIQKLLDEEGALR